MGEKKKVEKEKKGGVPIIVVILLLVIIIMLGAFGAYIMFFNKGGKTSNAAATTNTVTQNDTEEATLSLNETIINLADQGTQRYAKVTVAFGYDSKNSKLTSELTDKANDKTPIFSDAVISILRTKTSADLSNNKSLTDIKQEILNAVNPYLKNGKFDNVYFSELVVQ